MKTDTILRSLTVWILFILLFITNNLQSQPPDSLWQHHYGGVSDEIGFDAIEGEVGYYYIIGKTESYGNGGYDAYLLKLDQNGSVIWDKTYGGYMDEQILSICPAQDGGFVMTGFSKSNELGETLIWLLWVNEDGDSLWSKTYPGKNSGNGLHISPANNQGYIVSAVWGAGFPVGDEIYLMNLDVAGDTIWTKIFSGPNQDYGEEVIHTSDGGFIVAGRSYASFTPESCDAWVIKTDQNGDTLWTRKYGGNDEDIFNCVTETDDGYIFAGLTRSYGPGYYAVWAVRIGFSGDTVWTRTYGGDVAQLCFTISELDNGHFVLGGYSNSFNQNNDVYVLEIDIDGNLIWEEHYGLAAGSEIMYGSRQTSDGSFIITGKTGYYFSLEDEIFVLKLGEGNSGTPEEEQKDRPSFSVFPNPCHYAADIYVDIPGKTIVSLHVYNAYGKLVKTLIDGKSIQGKEQLPWNTSKSAPGIYFCRMIAGDDLVVKKVIIGR